MIQLVGAGGLFTRLGAIFCAQAALAEATGETVPDSINAALSTFDADTIPFRALVDALASQTQQLPSNNSGLNNTLQQIATQTVVAMVQDDAPQQSATLQPCMTELIRQMRASGATVTRTNVGASVGATDGDGTGVVIVSTKRTDGLSAEDLFAEAITLVASSPESFAVAGEAPGPGPLYPGWPGGSGASGSVAINLPGSSIVVLNGSFEADDTTADQPDDWIVEVGSPGSTVYLSAVPVQTLTVTGTPTAGTYLLVYTDPQGREYPTEPLAYNAGESEVQTALASLPGLEGVSVTATGTAPDYVHEITFFGVSTPAILAVVNRTTGGTITPAITEAGYPAFTGARVLFFEGDGSEQTSILQQLSVVSLTQYGFCLMQRDGAAGVAGQITVDLYDGLNTIADQQGAANSLTFPVAGAASGDWLARTAIFRTPENLPPRVYLRIRASTAIQAAGVAALDGVSLVVMSALYPGGPSVAAFEGSTPFAIGDRIVITATSDRAGTFQLDFDENFGMRDMGLILPSAQAGSIPNTLACGVQPSSSSSSSSA